ncbi:hypothetical protein [Pseudomonas aeruginosa]|uniref:hypothetical protein n=1 Tax=Pseudomonas aeruginosa TaxID=287 RepID=UPI000281B238|nr:hypothetical protein [Pseudomonas aeruginosa]EKA51684.1 hypothetical protein PAE2_4158 [Pseudomonas aeruginosa E2]MDI3456112.1 hypothetical protein [Pseudomonas aeruginosa]HCF7342797.1 hypothetical protein [Pseudomonas aeruginosa]
MQLMLGDESQHARYSIWLWLYLQYCEKANFAPETCCSSEMQKVTSGYFDGRPDFIAGDISTMMVRWLAPTEHLAWISEDDRQIRWLLPRLEEITKLSELRALPRLLGRELLVGMIDLWNEDLSEKIKQLQWLHDDWLRHKARDSQLKWFKEKKEGTDRCQYAWSWLQKNDEWLLSRRSHPFENYQDLLIFFDSKDLRERERKDIVQSIRQSWNRQKYLERLEDRKQYNFILSNRTIDLLDKMVTEHGMKRPELLELLVEQESERGLYLRTT